MTQPNCVWYVILLFTAQDPTNRLKGECHGLCVETQCNLKKKKPSYKICRSRKIVGSKAIYKNQLYFYTVTTIMWVEKNGIKYVILRDKCVSVHVFYAVTTKQSWKKFIKALSGFDSVVKHLPNM